MTKAGFLGRFQPFHLGHHNAVKQLNENYSEPVIIVGSSGKSRTEDNPLSFEERKKLIEACHPDIEILKLEDVESDEEWMEKLEGLDLDKVISRNDNVHKILENSDLEVERPQMFDEKIYSGTEVRRRIKSGEEWRYLTPKCSHKALEGLLEAVKKSGTQYNFEPGWERENSYHDTAEK